MYSAGSLRDNNYKIQADRLFARRTQYSTNDSLNLIGNELISIGKAHADTSVILNGKLLKARYEWRSSNYVAAMKTSLEALSTAQTMGLNERIPELYRIIGNLYKENENYPSALSAARKSVRTAEALQDTEQTIIGLLNLGMFTHSYSMQRNDPLMAKKSLSIYLKGLKLAESNPKYEHDRIVFYDNLSQYYKRSGDYDNGIYFGNEGVRLALKYHQNISLTYSYDWLGQIYFYQGDHAKGLEYLNRALKIALKIKNVYREMEINRALYTCYHSIGKDKKALAYFTRSVAISDSLQVEKNVKEIGKLQIQYETGRKDQEIASLGAVNREKTKKTILILIGLVSLFVLFIFLFIQYQVIRHRNKLLTSSNQKINEQAQQLQILMKELHHRVKNNLQIVSSLLSLQSNHLTDKDALRAVQQRIEAMSLIHRSLYQQENPNLVNIQEYITGLVESIVQSFGIDENTFDLHLEIDVTEMDVDMALPLGLIINEWITNAFKHAYNNIDHPALYLSLKMDKEIKLKIKDNGPGMNLEVWEKPNGSFGVKLVKVLSKQLNGVCEVKNENGTQLNLQIPMKLKNTG